MPTLADLFNLDPNVERLTLLPRLRGSLPSDPGSELKGSVMLKGTGMESRYMPDVIAPKVLYDFIRAVKAPGRAARGEALDEEEALNTALNMFGGGLATSGGTPLGSFGMGARVGGKTIRELLYGDKPNLTPAEKSAITRFEKELKVPAVRRREEMRAAGGDIIRPTEGMVFINEIGLRPEALVDKRLVPVMGDLSAAGGTVSQVAGVPLSKDVFQQGGRRYSLIKPNVEQKVAWASEPSAASSKVANLNAYPDEDVLGIFVGMGPESINFSHHMTDPLLAQLPAIQPSKDAYKQFNQAVREVWTKDPNTGERRYPFKNFPGIDSPNIEELITKGTDEYAPGALRTAIADKMSDAKFRNMGFPRWEDTAKAMSEPGLKQGFGGQTIFKAIPGSSIVTPDFTHRSYSAGIPGQYVGGLINAKGEVTGVPADLLFSRMFKGMREAGKTEHGIARSMLLSHHGEKFTEQALDPLMRFLGY